MVTKRRETIIFFWGGGNWLLQPFTVSFCYTEQHQIWTGQITCNSRFTDKGMEALSALPDSGQILYLQWHWFHTDEWVCAGRANAQEENHLPPSWARHPSSTARRSTSSTITFCIRQAITSTSIPWHEHPWLCQASVPLLVLAAPLQAFLGSLWTFLLRHRSA